ncbi:bud site selection protein 7-related [Anaeramoeba flamelloides]|uniref:Bud site selection protein 7-related n=1 Tax=Anaeramoeba flamelloides TaxID=1746091 RepID=A0AAV7Z133_9EUKA|nr:bud site selection protein 7-related [Anaeramoeba flamelloides]
MDYLRATSECVEHELFGSIKLRRKLIKKNNEILGSPDLCHILKVNPQTKLKTRVGFYHVVHGLRIGSVSSVEAYFGSLLSTTPTNRNNQAQEKLKKKKKKNKKQWEVETLTLYSYNAFRKEDLVVKLKLPDTLTCYTLDCNEKQTINPSEQFWIETLVCSFLRWSELPKDKSVSSTFFDRWLSVNLVDDFLLDPQPQILENAIMQTIQLGHRLGTFKYRMIPTLASNRLINGFQKYLFGQHRYKYIVQVFTKLADLEMEPELLWVAAKGLRMQGDLKKGETTLKQALTTRPSSFFLIEGIHQKRCSGLANTQRR